MDRYYGKANKQRIRDMIDAFEKCIWPKSDKRLRKYRYLCHRLSYLHNTSQIRYTAEVDCRELVMRALEGQGALEGWVMKNHKLPYGKRVPSRNAWARKLAKDLRQYL